MNPVDRIAALFETLTPADVDRLGDYYRPDATFKDPFNEAVGVADIQRIFRDMFATLEAPRFTVTRRFAQGSECVLMWEFNFRSPRMQGGRPQSIRGASHLQLAADGRIMAHRDYWDAAAEVYEKLPVLGWLMRWLRRRGSALD